MIHGDSSVYKYVTPVVQALMESGAHTAIKIVSPRSVVRATRQAYGGKFKSGPRREEIHVGIGVPNYHARKLIKACLKVNEPFPVRKVQLQFIPVKRKA